MKTIDAALPINTLQYNGEDAIDIVFIADGFTLAEQPVYNNRVTQAIGYLFDNPPFDAHQGDFNIYSIPAVSNESGISVLGGITVDTAFGSFMNRDNLPGYSGIPEDKRAELRNELKKVFKKKIYPIMILNTQTYGGSGELNKENRFMSIAQITLDGEYNAFRELIIHEFGHSFVDLADEYGGSCTDADRVSDWDHDHYDKRNVTYDNVNDRKWDSLVSNPQYFLGANYCDNEWYRSSNSDIMRSVASGNIHNELGQIISLDRINEDISYNANVVSYQSDGLMNLPSSEDKNIRVHADESILTSHLVCNNLYVAEDSNLIINPGVTIDCDTMDILGTLTYKKRNRKKGRAIRYGCKDPNAKNFTRFARHRPSLCVYGKQYTRPPHYIDEERSLSVHSE